MGKGDGSAVGPSFETGLAANGQIGEAALGPEVTWEERERTDERNRMLLDRDLREKRLVFESRPYEAHVQFSNFCNMSCIMCWNGKNPPVVKMSPELLARLGSEVAPELTFITPHDGSEPTVVTWDETVALTKQSSVRLWLTTNGQEFDEDKFHEVEDLLDLLVVSIDSHLPEVFEQIRPGAKADRVYRNLETVARLCEERGIQCMVTVVFMTINAPLMADTVAWLADRGVSMVSVTQMIDTNRESWHLDATMHYSAEYLDWIKRQCVAVAENRRIALDWYLSGHEVFDFREPHRQVQATVRDLHYADDERRKLMHPGFCAWAYHRLKVRVNGQVSPCGLDTASELNLGNLATQSFEEIWNGKAARDLRRAHFTSDYPNLCKSCRYVDLPPPQATLPALEKYLDRWGIGSADVEGVLAVGEPDHMLRVEVEPAFTLREPPEGVVSYRLLLSPGGQPEGTQVLALQLVEATVEEIELRMPDGAWDQLETNVGLWWTVLGMGADPHDPPLARMPELRCLIRHEHLPRIEGSGLKYPDEGNFPMLYLGGNRQVGWEVEGELPRRPPLRHRPDAPPGRRFASRRKDVSAGSTNVGMTAEAYGERVNHVRHVVANAIPEGAVAAVAAKGDDSLLDVAGRDLRHFPADGEGGYAGHHPLDDAWAIDRLGEARAAGAEYLVIPAWLRWWLDHYRGFAEHLGEPIVDDRDQCTIFDLRRLAAPEHDVTLEELADRTLGYGGHHRMAFRRFHGGQEDDPFPRFAVDAYGYHLVDSEGREFVDWVSGGGPVILGYRHPAVTEAITRQLPVGPTLTLTHPVEVQVAELLTEMIPCAERVAFGKNGSDALTAAVRLARAATGRELILQYGGHGFHDWYVARFGVPGVPKALRQLVCAFPYNDLDALGALFEEHDGEVAAVVMEPLDIELPKPGYLEGVRELAHRHGALLVFDEVITSFRVARGGAQERFGVVPDLACLGKAMANGMPLSAVVGRREYMQRLPEVAYGMTFRGETLSLAAARAVLQTLRQSAVHEQLERVGGEVRAAFERACEEAGVKAELRGPEARMTFVFGDQAAVPHERLEAAFVLECARRGILTNGNILPSLAHDDEAVSRTAAAFGPALEGVKELVTAATVAVGQAVRAGFAACGLSAAAEEVRPPAGFLDMVRDDGGNLTVQGWLLPDEHGPVTVELTGAGGARRVADRVERPDVASLYEGVPDAVEAGFVATLPPEEFLTDGRWDFTLRAVRGDETLFLSHITRPRFSYDGVELRPSRLGDDGTLHL